MTDATVDPAILGTVFDSYEVEYDERDTIFYALGVGAGRTPAELPYVYEERLEALPTQPVVAVSRVFIAMTGVLGIDGTRRVHGEQRLVLHRPPPPRGRVRVEARVVGVWDKDPGAIVDVEANLTLDGEPLATAIFASFVRGGGGFGGERGDGGLRTPAHDGGPAVVMTEEMGWNQALLYRLTGDLNPLHIDPVFARESGFDRPIAHGLCTYGYATRMAMLGLDLGPADLAEANCRFNRPVYPGQVLRLEAWEPRDGRLYARLLADGAPVIDPLELVLREPWG